jgi:hypothetical protein
MNAKKAVTWLAVALVVFYLLVSPAAGDTVRSVYDGMEDAGNSLAAFVSSVP